LCETRGWTAGAVHPRVPNSVGQSPPEFVSRIYFEGGRRGRPPPRTKFGRAKPSRICLTNLFCRRTAGPSTPAYQIRSGKALPNLSPEFIFAGGRRGPSTPAYQIRSASGLPNLFSRTKFGRAKPSRICLTNLFLQADGGAAHPRVPNSVGLRPSEFILAYKIWSGKALPNLSHEFIFAGGRQGPPAPRFVGGRRGRPPPAYQIRSASGLPNLFSRTKFGRAKFSRIYFEGGRRGPPAPAHQIREADASRTHVLECTPPKIGGGPRLSGGRGCGRGSCTSRRIRTCGGRAASKRGKTPKSANNI